MPDLTRDECSAAVASYTTQIGVYSVIPHKDALFLLGEERFAKLISDLIRRNGPVPDTFYPWNVIDYLFQPAPKNKMTTIDLPISADLKKYVTGQIRASDNPDDLSEDMVEVVLPNGLLVYAGWYINAYQIGVMRGLDELIAPIHIVHPTRAAVLTAKLAEAYVNLDEYKEPELGPNEIALDPQGILWDIKPVLIQPSDPDDGTMVQFQWGWTAGISEEDLKDWAEDAPRGYESVTCYFFQAVDLHERLGKFIEENRSNARERKEYSLSPETQALFESTFPLLNEDTTRSSDNQGS